MPDMQAVPFDGPPAGSAASDTGHGSVETTLSPDNLPAADPTQQSSPPATDTTPALDPPAKGDDDMSFGENLLNFGGDDGDNASSIDSAAEYLREQALEDGGDKPQPTDGIIDDDTTGTEPQGDQDFFAMLAADPQIGASAHQLRDKYGADPMAAMRGLMNAQQRLSQRDEFASVGRSVKEDPEYAKHLLGLNPQAPEGQADPAEAQRSQEWQEYLQRVWQAPEYKAEWEDQIEVQYDDAGTAVGVKPKEGAPKDVVDNLKRWNKFKDDRLNQFLQDPGSTLSNAILPIVDQLVQQRMQQGLQQNNVAAEAKAFGSNFRDQHSNWLYNPGAPQNADNLSPAGQVFYQGLSEANQKGLHDTKDQIEWATYRLQQATAQAAPSGDTGQPAPAEQHNARRQAATASPSAGAPANGGAQPLFKAGENLEDRIMANLRNPALFE
jgi:hypothetical protein